MTNIPQTAPLRGYEMQKADIDAAIARVLTSGWYILGPEVEAFEHAFAAYAGVKYAVGVANGTDALVIALKALSIGPGDAVVTVSHTAVATVAAIEQTGAQAILVDVDETGCMDPSSLEAVLANPAARGIKAVIIVHLYGMPADMARLVPLVERHGLTLIEDCSQAHGARLNGRMVGQWGAMATYSLYPTKNLGALGDGGLITTQDAGLAERTRLLRQYGWKSHYISDIAGQNSRLDPLQAAILGVKLTRLEADNDARRRIAVRYDEALDGLVPRIGTRAGAQPVYHQYVLRHGRRDALKAALAKHGVMTNIHYPVPVHKQPAYEGRILITSGGLPATERLAADVLSLPMFPQLTDSELAQVIEAVRRSLGEV